MSGTTKQIADYAPAASLSRNDFMLMQQGGLGTPYTKATPAQLFATLSQSDITTALGYAPFNATSGGNIGGDIVLTGTGALTVPVGTTLQQPSAGNVGSIRYNSTTGRYEFGAGSTWKNHVRLDGDTMTGNLNLLGLTATGSITFGSAAGSGPSDIIAANTGTVRVTVPALINFRNSSGTSFLQLNLNGTNTSFLPLTVGPTVVISGAAPTNATTLANFTAGALTGVSTANNTYGLLNVTNVSDAAQIGANNGTLVLQSVVFNTTPGIATGSRAAQSVQLAFRGPTGNKAAGNPVSFYGASSNLVLVLSGDGGTDLTSAGAYGNFYAWNPVAHAGPLATFLHNLSGGEINILAEAGSSMRFKNGFDVSQITGSTSTAGAPEGDGVFYIANSNNAVGWRAFGLPYFYWPFGANASLIKGYLDISGGISAAQWFADMRHVTFPATGNAYDGGLLRSKGISIDGKGDIRRGTGYIMGTAGGISIDAKGSLGVSGTPTAGQGGTNWITGYYGTDPYGGVWKATAVAGVVTVWTMIDPPNWPTTTPPTTGIPITAYGSALIDGGATGAQIDIVWNTTGTALSLQPTAGGKIGLFGATPVVRDSGWTPMTGTPDKATTFATASVTLPQLAGRVMQMQSTLTALGVTGP